MKVMDMITIKLISWQDISMLVTLLQPKGIQATENIKHHRKRNWRG